MNSYTRAPLNHSSQRSKPVIRRPEEKKEETPVIPDLVEIKPEAKVQVISLGGLGEIGKNTWAFRYEDQILIVDAGLGFPNDQMQGVDLVLPELTYLIENQDKIVGMLITHGHEDHIGGVPNMLRSVNIPIIYGPPLAIGLIEGKLKEHGLLPKANLKRIKPRETVQLGSFAITFIRNNHSIPDSFSLVIQSPAGRIIHSGDFKFDHTPVDGELFDIAALSEASRKGVALLISDSTNAERVGYTPSEKQVYPHLEEIFVRASKRIIITTFASQVHRIRQILEIATKYGRKVAILGRSMLNIALISRQLGYMTFPDGLLIRAEEVSQYPLNKIVILTTGSQGEPLSALTRIANGSHKQISIIPGDTVVMSATPIPGNERAVATTINALFSRGAEVVYGRDAGVHVSGHCSQEEQKLMLSLVKPKYFMPAHGEYRMLVKHAKLAEEVCDLPPEHTFVMENGDILEVSNEKAAVVGQVPAGIIMVDGSARNDSIKEETLLHRKQLSTQGIANLVLTLNKDQILGGPDIVFKGLVFANAEESQELIEELKLKVTESWTELSKLPHDQIKCKIEGFVLDALEAHRQAPLVQVFILEPSLV
ncbi:MAG: ribonuclease J [Candidatus Caenarcaniphilales bacterium]|nr:ribonuclease J [Candidatus Caenarcaniphilales bacterium]